MRGSIVRRLSERDAALRRRSDMHFGNKSKSNRVPHQSTTEEYMEPTVTESSALYLAHLKTSKERVAVFRRFRAAAIKYSPNRQQLAFGAFESDALAHHDNDR
jgi:hypothetical protein